MHHCFGHGLVGDIALAGVEVVVEIFVQKDLGAILGALRIPLLGFQDLGSAA